MTLSSGANYNNYTGDGTLDTYSYTFRIIAETDIVITIADDDGEEFDELTLTTDYTVTGVGEASGGRLYLLIPDKIGLTVTEIY